MKLSQMTGEQIYIAISNASDEVAELREALHSLEDAGLGDNPAYGIIKRTLSQAEDERRELGRQVFLRE